MRYNLHTMESTNFVCMVWWILTSVYAHVTTSIIRMQNIPVIQKVPYCPFHSNPPSLPSPRKPLIHFMSLQISFAYLGIFYKWNHTVCTFSGSGSFCSAYCSFSNITFMNLLVYVNEIYTLWKLSYLQLLRYTLFYSTQ